MIGPTIECLVVLESGAKSVIPGEILQNKLRKQTAPQESTAQ